MILVLFLRLTLTLFLHQRVAFILSPSHYSMMDLERHGSTSANTRKTTCYQRTCLFFSSAKRVLRWRSQRSHGEGPTAMQISPHLTLQLSRARWLPVTYPPLPTHHFCKQERRSMCIMKLAATRAMNGGNVSSQGTRILTCSALW